jgi:hypothetical protein
MHSSEHKSLCVTPLAEQSCKQKLLLSRTGTGVLGQKAAAQYVDN